MAFFPFLGFPLGIRDSISSASVIHPPFRFLLGNLLFYLPSNHLHVIDSFPSPSPPGFICLPAVFHSHTPTECQKIQVQFPWTILATFINFFFRQGRLFKWLPVKSKNKLIFHAFRFQSYDFLIDVNQVDKCCILLISKLKEKKNNLNSPHKNTLSVAQFSCMMSPKGIIFSSTESLPTKGQHLTLQLGVSTFLFFPPTFSTLLQCWHSNYSFMLLQSHVPLVHRETLHCAQTGNVALGR